MARLNLKPSTQPATSKEETESKTVRPEVKRTGHSMSLRAKPFAAALDKDESLAETMAVIIQAKEINDQKAYTIMRSFRVDLADLLPSLPIPDSRGGNNPDKYDIEGSKREGRFWYDLADDWSFGAAIVRKREQIKLARDENTKDKVTDEEIKAVIDSPIEVAKLAERYENKHNHLRRTFLDAGKLHFKLLAFEELEGLTIQFKMVPLRDENGAIVRENGKVVETYDTETSKPFMIRPADYVKEPDKYAQYSVGQLLKLDVDKVERLGGDWAAFKEATKRKPRTKDQDKEGAEEIHVTFKNVPDVVESFADFVEDIDDSGEWSKFDKLMIGDDAFCLRVYKIVELLHSRTERPAMREHFSKIETDLAKDGRPRTDGKQVEATA